MKDDGVRAVIDRARELGITIAVAESLTGGRLLARLIDVPGASHVVVGGIVSYHTGLKQSLLGVDQALLAAHGPVHPDVAIQMARGVREACAVTSGDGEGSVRADIGIATTGVAGPESDAVSGQPPGTVWIGVSGPAGEEATELTLEGDREAVREGTVQVALELLRLNLSQLD